MNIFHPQKIANKIRGMDLSSDYAFWVGLSSFIISFIVTILTFYNLLLNRTNILLAAVVSVIVFYVFSVLYSFIILLGLKIFRKNEDKL